MCSREISRSPPARAAGRRTEIAGSNGAIGLRRCDSPAQSRPCEFRVAASLLLMGLEGVSKTDDRVAAAVSDTSVSDETPVFGSPIESNLLAARPKNQVLITPADRSSGRPPSLGGARRAGRFRSFSIGEWH